MGNRKHLLPAMLCILWMLHIPCMAAAVEGEAYPMHESSEHEVKGAEAEEQETEAEEQETAYGTQENTTHEMMLSLAEGKRIQKAILEGEACITVYRDVLLEEPIRIPSGRSVAVDAAEGAKVTIRRTEDFDGSLFVVKPEARLILGRKCTGLLILEHTDAGKGEGAPICSEGLVMTGGGFWFSGMVLEEEKEYDAGNAWVVETGGEQSVSFEVADQEVEAGAEISKIAVPQAGIGADGEKVAGVVFWSDTEGGMPLPEDLLLSGSEGESMELYWTFVPEDSGYEPVSGKVNLTFREPAVKENEKTNLDINEINGGWEDGAPNTGNLSDSASAQGSTVGEGIFWQAGASGMETDSEPSGNDAEENGTAEEAGEKGETDIEEANGGADTMPADAALNGTNAQSSGNNPETGDGSEILFWTILLLGAFLVSTGRILSIIMGRI